MLKIELLGRLSPSIGCTVGGNTRFNLTALLSVDETAKLLAYVNLQGLHRVRLAG